MHHYRIQNYTKIEYKTQDGDQTKSSYKGSEMFHSDQYTVYI